MRRAGNVARLVDKRGAYGVSECRLQPALRYHITNSQSLKLAQYNLCNNAPSSRKLLKMDVLTSETYWAVNWHNKASVIKLVYLYSNILWSVYNLSTRILISFDPWGVYCNPLNADLNPICNFLALLGAHHILHVSRIRVNNCIRIQCNYCIYLKSMFCTNIDMYYFNTCTVHILLFCSMNQQMHN